MPRRKHHHVCVIELHKDVLLEPRFRKNNPNYVNGKPCMYVGFIPMRCDDAVDKEIEVAIDLQCAGFGVWQA